MNWIDIINRFPLEQLFFCGILTTVTGSVSYIGWKFSVRWLEKRKKHRVIYVLLKMVCVFFILPLSYGCVILSFLGEKDTFNGYWGMCTETVSVVIKSILLIWLIGFFVKTGLYINAGIKMKKIRRFNVPAEQNLQWVYERVSVHLGNRKKVEVYRNCLLEIPITVGVLHPIIILPSDVMKEQDLTVFLEHELTHIVHGDLWKKKIAVWIERIYWFNPLLYYLRKDLTSWSETMCDLAVCYEENTSCSPKEYFEVILKYASSPSRGVEYLSMGLFEERSQLEKRIKRMIGAKRVKKCGGWMTACICLLIMGSSVSWTAFAGKEASLFYDQIIDSTLESVEEPQISDMGNSDTAEVAVDLSDCSLAIVEMDTPKEFNSFYITQWLLFPESEIVTSPFHIICEEQIKIIVESNDFNVPMTARVRYLDGTMQTVSFQEGKLNAVFTVRQSGYCQVVFCNESKSLVRIHGVIEKSAKDK